MAERGSIEIPVTIKVTEQGGGSAPDVEKPAATDKAKEAAEKAAKNNQNAAAALARQMAGKVANTALNNFGNITGDYVAQQNLQSGISEATGLLAAAKLGWVGVALYAADKAVQGYNYYAGLKRNARDMAFQQKRVFGSTYKA